jgi:hypothetical protein
MFVEKHISSVPIVDDNNVVLNVYETVDVMVRFIKLYPHLSCILNHAWFSLQSIAKSGKYDELDVPVGVALEARPDVSISRSRCFDGHLKCVLISLYFRIFLVCIHAH